VGSPHVLDIVDLLAHELGSAKVLRGEEKLHAYARDESDLPAFWPDGPSFALHGKRWRWSCASAPSTASR
jgi:hypothetical protein